MADAPSIQWAVVYIREAHAADVWPLKYSYERPAPASAAERAQYARDCAAELGFTRADFRLLCDGMDDAFNTALGAWPTAYYVLDRSGCLVFIGEAPDGEFSFDVRAVIRFVHRLGGVQRASGRRGSVPAEPA